MAQFPLCTDDNPVILLEGEQLLISTLYEEICALINSVCTNDPPMLIDRPGLFQFLNTKYAKLAIEGMKFLYLPTLRLPLKLLRQQMRQMMRISAQLMKSSKVQLRKGNKLY